MKIILRDYQTDLINNTRTAYASGAKAPLVVLPTGGGKTVVFCDIAERVASKGNRAIIIVHRAELLRQTSTHLDKLGVDHGLIAPGHMSYHYPVSIASVYTLARRLHKIPAPNLIIVDECHHALANTWATILREWSTSRVLGVTATPCRLDGKGLRGFFDVMIQGPTVSDLISKGALCKPIVYAPPSGVSLDGVHVKYGDYVQSEVEAAINKPKITGCAISHYKKLCPGMPAIAFCTSVKHAENVAEMFCTSGVPALSLDGSLSDSMRKQRIEMLADGRIKVLTSCDIISEGTDIPVVSAAILLRPTKSLGLYLQQCGRALRPAPQIGKVNAIILDHVGNALQHGLPDEDREWSLDGVVKKKSGKKTVSNVRQCEQCYFVYSVFADKCPQCGRAPEKMAREDIEQVDGDLVEFTPEIRKQKRVEVGMCRTLEDYIAIGKARGYKPSWAYIAWNIKRNKLQRVA